MEMIIVSMIVFAMLVACALKVYRHEKWQNHAILSLRSEINFLKMKIELYTNHQFKWKEDAYNYFAIGNSITLHGKCGYWWCECGMAASMPKYDYFHQTSAMLKEVAHEYGGGYLDMRIIFQGGRL